MSSSVSVLDRESSASWRRWLLIFFITAAGAATSLFGFVLIMDPFSSGKLTPIKRFDSVVGNRALAAVGRVRDPQFNAAILGNSHAVRIMPSALDRETGRRFVMLAIEGTWPSEHIFLMQEFDRRRSGAIFVVALDDQWCSHEINHSVIVPRWLYADSNLRYASQILSPLAIRSAWRKFLMLAGLEKALPADGYDPRLWRPWGHERMKEIMLNKSPPEGADTSGAFPYLDELERTLPRLNANTLLLLVFTPVYTRYLPAPGTHAEGRLNACKGRANAIASRRPLTGMLDLRVDGPKVRDVNNFVDGTHYTDDIARDVEAAIVLRIADMLGAARR